MYALIAAILLAGVLAYLFVLRAMDLPEPAPALPYAHLEARRAQIYDNLRDLQFEYRVGKLSDADYQTTKNGLQGELAHVLAEIDRMKGTTPAVAAAPVNGKAKAPAAAANVCPHCGANFPQALKFCGECGKPMEVKA